MRILKSAFIGMVLAIAMAALAYALSPVLDAVGIYVSPGVILLPLIPMKLGHWLYPEGGPTLGVFLLLLSAILFWTILFGAGHFVWVLLKSRRS